MIIIDMTPKLELGRVYVQLSEGSDYNALRRVAWAYGKRAHYVATAFDPIDLRRRLYFDVGKQTSESSKKAFEKDFPPSKFVSYRETVRRVDGSRPGPPVRNSNDDGRYGLAGCVRELAKACDETIIILPTTSQLMLQNEFAERDSLVLTAGQTCTAILQTFGALVEQLPGMKASVIVPANTDEAFFGSFNRALLNMAEKIV